MDYSYSQATAVTCGRCRATYAAPIWIIVDPRQNSRLAQTIADGDLNKLTCPGCKIVTTFQNPILLYQRDEAPSMVIGAPPSQPRQDTQEQANVLLAFLYNKLSPEEKKALIANPDIIFPPPVVVPLSALKDFTDSEGRRPISTGLKAIIQCLESIPEGAPKEEVYKLAKRALELLDARQNPQYWAWLKGLLSSAASNVEEGILHLQDSLTVFTREESPENWGRGQSDLAHLYLDRTTGSRIANIETAISHFKMALQTLTPGTSPVFWAMCNNDLSVAYSERIVGERTENLELALFHAHATLDVFGRETFPEYWARSHTRIGAVLRDRLVGDRADNLSQAVNHYNLALKCYTHLQDTVEAAGIHSLLGQAYVALLSTRETPEDLPDRAIHHLELALRVITKEQEPDRWATIVGNLALAYEFRGTGDRDTNIQQAIDYFRRTEEIFSRDTFPDRWADTQANIAGLYMHLEVGDQREIDSKKVELLRSAAEVYDQTNQPAKFIDTQQRLGAIYLVNHQWSDAHDAYDSALKAAYDLFGNAYTAAGRQSELVSVSGLCADDAYSLFQLRQHNAALERLEQGRARLLKEALASENLSLTEINEADRSRLKMQQQLVDQLEAAMQSSSSSDPTHRSVRQVAEELRLGRATLKDLLGMAASKRQRSADLTFAEILSMVPVNGALIAPFRGLGGSSFVIPYGRRNLSEADVVELISPLDPTSQPGNTREFVDSMCSIVSRMAEPIVERLSNLGLAEGSPIVVMGGALDLFALHATSRQTAHGTRFFIDDYTVRYVPSCALLRICQHRLQAREPDKSSVLTVTNPTNDLRFAQAESDALSELFARPLNLPGNKATPEAVIREIKGMPYVHFACHGYYLPKDPLHSGLRLANNTQLTAAEVILRLDLSASRLVVLSACETGLTDFGRLKDEYVGLPAAFLQAGAPAVLSTLWEVNDMSTMLLMERFYKSHCIENVPAPSALRDAQLWLRNVTNAELAMVFDRFRQTATDRTRMTYDAAQEHFVRHTLSDPSSKPFEHPFFWAGFTYTGAEV
jgi:CHAT domain-containing protein/tetratricopeptide (TPR) repeat protein